MIKFFAPQNICGGLWIEDEYYAFDDKNQFNAPAKHTKHLESMGVVKVSDLDIKDTSPPQETEEQKSLRMASIGLNTGF